MNAGDQPEAWVYVQAHGVTLIPKEASRGDRAAAGRGVSCSCWGVTRAEDPGRTEEGDPSVLGGWADGGEWMDGRGRQRTGLQMHTQWARETVRLLP